MEELGFLLGDCRSAWSDIKHKERQAQLKRRWLLGFYTSEREQKKFKREDIFDDGSLPESLVRKDDIFVDTVKSCVEEAFGVRCQAETEHEVVSDGLALLGTEAIERAVVSHMDNLTSDGRCLLAKILTGNRIELKAAKTNRKMKKIVRESLPVVFESRIPNNGDYQKNISRQITEFLNNPQNFCDSCVPIWAPRTLTQRATVEVLNELESLPCQTLIAMHEKLKEKQQTMPLLKPPRSGFNRDHLIKQVKKRSEKMLSKLSKEDQLPGPLAKAMAVASLSLKLTRGFHYSTPEFYKVSSETEALQNEIINAIWLVKTKVGMPVLENVKNLLDPNAKVSNRSLRTAIRKTLTEYLFGCSDMNTVPKSLFQILATINRYTQKTPSIVTLRKEIDKEIECILNVGAHTKQILLDLLPAIDFDDDFANAYMEDPEDSDDELDYFEYNRYIDYNMEFAEDNFSQRNSWDEEGTADVELLDSRPSTSRNNAMETCLAITDERSKSVQVDGLEAKVSSCVEQNACKNRYLAIQEGCDATSMVAYSLICRLLEEFGRKEGLDFEWYHSLHRKHNRVNKQEDLQVVALERASAEESEGAIMARVVEDLLPTFPMSGIVRLRKLLGS